MTKPHKNGGIEMNVATVTGNLGKDIELVITSSGVTVGKGTLAVKGSFKDKKTGEYPTNWINFVAFGKVAEILSNYSKKGDKLGITGEIQTGSYENSNGQKVYTYEINVNGFDLPPKSNNTQPNIQQQNHNETFEVQEEDLPF